MAKHDFILGESQDLPSVPVCQLRFDLLHDHDSVYKLDSERIQGLDLVCSQDNEGLVQTPSQRHEHGMDSQHQQQEHAQNLEQNGVKLDANDQVQEGLDLLCTLDNEGVMQTLCQRHEHGMASQLQQQEHAQNLEQNGVKLDANDLVQEGLDLLCTLDNEGVMQTLSRRHEHGMASQLQQQEHAQNLEQNGAKLDVNDQVQEHAYPDNYDNRLALDNQSCEVNLSNNRQLAIVEDHHELHGKLEFSLDQSEEMGNLPLSDVIAAQPMDMVFTSPVLQSRALDPSPNHQLAIGQQFPDVHSCRRALREAAIALHFEIQTIKSDKVRFTAQCASEGCTWRIHAAKLPGVPTFSIRTIREPHTCAGLTHLGHQQASVQWVAESVEQHIRENPNCKPKELLERIHQDHGITLSYKQAWRGKERIEASGLPIIQMMECIRRQLMTLFNERREGSMQWSGILVPFAEKQVAEAIEQSQNYQVLRGNEAEFEVLCHSGSAHYVVDIRTRRCSCWGWQGCGLPCSHAAAVLLSCRQNVHRFTESYFTVANYRKTYSKTIHPVPDKAMWNMSEYVEGSGALEIVINPPKCLKSPGTGRPKKKRASSAAQDSAGRNKRVVHCSRCNQPGHFRTTCSVPV
ncbi:hypothetical protein RJT34_22580 [Clitoria ternatea]|uniref:SWIM-type domain-containing protein n=1 Tax=Clitoria ternatea TaxID=43366 RepID=A0AAN9FKB7_CLITE